ncbi:hypothetical protein A3770_08p51680 [Chloropicon primus]|uniref:Uncharacterized protein n=1 Tax=Chloropicon primus TaxID=1764295 RepID=A0A5B8MTA1_9CHLO|nr:hypothetical protein A3770_08p51680 [Chloropicon primus]|eukprot:QDZ22650.1 hypothetical protein A3770_08p51680 [Chloropicon primus]
MERFEQLAEEFQTGQNNDDEVALMPENLERMISRYSCQVGNANAAEEEEDEPWSRPPQTLETVEVEVASLAGPSKRTHTRPRDETAPGGSSPHHRNARQNVRDVVVDPSVSPISKQPSAFELSLDAGVADAVSHEPRGNRRKAGGARIADGSQPRKRGRPMGSKNATKEAAKARGSKRNKASKKVSDASNKASKGNNDEDEMLEWPPLRPARVGRISSFLKQQMTEARGKGAQEANPLSQGPNAAMGANGGGGSAGSNEEAQTRLSPTTTTGRGSNQLQQLPLDGGAPGNGNAHDVPFFGMGDLGKAVVDPVDQGKYDNSQLDIDLRSPFDLSVEHHQGPEGAPEDALGGISGKGGPVPPAADVWEEQNLFSEEEEEDACGRGDRLLTGSAKPKPILDINLLDKIVTMSGSSKPEEGRGKGARGAANRERASVLVHPERPEPKSPERQQEGKDRRATKNAKSRLLNKEAFVTLVGLLEPLELGELMDRAGVERTVRDHLGYIDGRIKLFVQLLILQRVLVGEKMKARLKMECLSKFKLEHAEERRRQREKAPSDRNVVLYMQRVMKEYKSRLPSMTQSTDSLKKLKDKVIYARARSEVEYSPSEERSFLKEQISRQSQLRDQAQHETSPVEETPYVDQQELVTCAQEMDGGNLVQTGSASLNQTANREKLPIIKWACVAESSPASNTTPVTDVHTPLNAAPPPEDVQTPLTTNLRRDVRNVAAKSKVTTTSVEVLQPIHWLIEIEYALFGIKSDIQNQKALRLYGDTVVFDNADGEAGRLAISNAGFETNMGSLLRGHLKLHENMFADMFESGKSKEKEINVSNFALQVCCAVDKSPAELKGGMKVLDTGELCESLEGFLDSLMAHHKKVSTTAAPQDLDRVIAYLCSGKEKKVDGVSLKGVSSPQKSSGVGEKYLALPPAPPESREKKRKGCGSRRAEGFRNDTESAQQQKRRAMAPKGPEEIANGCCEEVVELDTNALLGKAAQSKAIVVQSEAKHGKGKGKNGAKVPPQRIYTGSCSSRKVMLQGSMSRAGFHSHFLMHHVEIELLHPNPKITLHSVLSRARAKVEEAKHRERGAVHGRPRVVPAEPQRKQRSIFSQKPSIGVQNQNTSHDRGVVQGESMASPTQSDSSGGEDSTSMCESEDPSVANARPPSLEWEWEAQEGQSEEPTSHQAVAVAPQEGQAQNNMQIVEVKASLQEAMQNEPLLLTEGPYDESERDALVQDFLNHLDQVQVVPYEGASENVTHCEEGAIQEVQQPNSSSGRQAVVYNRATGQTHRAQCVNPGDVSPVVVYKSLRSKESTEFSLIEGSTSRALICKAPVVSDIVTLNPCLQSLLDEEAAHSAQDAYVIENGAIRQGMVVMVRTSATLSLRTPLFFFKHLF